MDRKEKFMSYIQEYNSVAFNAHNIPLILENLEKAEADGQLIQFLRNEKPYRCAYQFVGTTGTRGKDQIAIVLALNTYGESKPDFVFRLHGVLKQLLQGNPKDMEAAYVLLAAQMELQSLGASLIDFVDNELLAVARKAIGSTKGKQILKWILLMVGGAIGAPGFAMAGLVLLSPFAGFLCFYSIMKLVAWCCMPTFKNSKFDTMTRPVGNPEK